MIYTIQLTRKKDGNSISRDYELNPMGTPEDTQAVNVGIKVKDMQRTIEESTETKF